MLSYRVNSIYAFTINLSSFAVTQVLDTQTRMLQILEGYMQVSSLKSGLQSRVGPTSSMVSVQTIPILYIEVVAYHCGFVLTS